VISRLGVGFAYRPQQTVAMRTAVD